MFHRQRSGSVLCPGCGYLVGVSDERCYHCGRWNPGLWGLTPVLRRLGNDLGFGYLVTLGCSALYAAMLLASANPLGSGGALGLLAPDTRALFLFGASGAVPVFDLDRWWTPLSAGWLHAGLLHIIFNLMWVRHLAPPMAELYGPSRTVIVYTIAGVAGFLLSSAAGYYLEWLPFLRGASFTVGASAPVFGLLGALLYYGHRSGSSMMRAEVLRWAAIAFVFGLIMPGIDNYAHAGGFAGGYLAGRLLDPLQRERVDHLIAALGCLLATALAIAASIVTGLPLLAR